MASAIRGRLGRLSLWLACLLSLVPARVAAGLYELNLTTDGQATTGAQMTISATLAAKDNSSLTLPASAHLYHFHWIHTPLMLTGKTENELTSTIHVVSSVPGDFPVSVWVTSADCWMCQPMARSFAVLSFTELLVGDLVVTQNTSLPSPSSYLTKTVLKVTFVLHDPSNFFQTASFLYNWDFGDGTQMVTEDGVVYYNYSVMGAFTVKLKVVAEWEQAQPDGTKAIMQKTGDFAASLKLQEPGDKRLGLCRFSFLSQLQHLLQMGTEEGHKRRPETLRGIQVFGPTVIQSFQKMTVTLNFLGSPPLNVCWRLKPECLPLEEGECHPVSVSSTAYNLTHIFRTPGDYCFSIRAENAISKTHQYHRIQVWPSSFQPAVFAFPCATLITLLLAFIMYMTLRNAAQQKDMEENLEPHSGVRCCCQSCCGPFWLETPSEYLEIVRENHRLLPPLKSVKTYTV